MHEIHLYSIPYVQRLNRLIGRLATILEAISCQSTIETRTAKKHHDGNSSIATKIDIPEKITFPTNNRFSVPSLNPITLWICPIV